MRVGNSLHHHGRFPGPTRELQPPASRSDPPDRSRLAAFYRANWPTPARKRGSAGWKGNGERGILVPVVIVPLLAPGLRFPMTAPAVHAAHPPTNWKAVGILLVCAAAGSALAWPLIPSTRTLFPVDKKLQAVAFSPATDAQKRELAAAERIQKIQQVGAAGILIGLCCCGLLGLGAGLTRSMGRAVLGLLVGVLLGAIFGGAGGLFEEYVLGRLPPLKFTAAVDPASVNAMVAHSVLWLVMTAGLGLVVGVARGSMPDGARAWLAGLAGSLIAGSAFPLAAAAFFPMAKPEVAVPYGGPSDVLTVVWLCSWSLLTAFALGRLLPATVVAPVPAGTPHVAEPQQA